ncbi:Uncharacterised protein [Shigella flexneri]|nr:Uncharacterised protein [Shigella flexneri]
MRVIHHHRRFAWRSEHFHTSANRLQTRGGFQQISQWIAQRQQCCQREQQVADVKSAHQMAFNFAIAPA